jgi:hypothetical protein
VIDYSFLFFSLCVRERERGRRLSPRVGESRKSEREDGDCRHVLENLKRAIWIR